MKIFYSVDQDESPTVEKSSEGGKMPNPMQVDSQDDFGLCIRFCAFVTRHER